jgi:hypothetical protein
MESITDKAAFKDGRILLCGCARTSVGFWWSYIRVNVREVVHSSGPFQWPTATGTR